jgi:hydroxyacylglutathione hydrolase
MEVVPFRHPGLGNTAYLLDLGDGGAALVDPGRAIEPYLRAARERAVQIVAVLETHVHADFVTGSLEVAEATGAEVFLPAEAGVQFPHRSVRAGQSFTLGKVEVEAIASPGHTPEHLSYVARMDEGAPALFSGGSLIVAGAARTDLIAPDLTEDLTRAQFRSLHHAFRDLPDETKLMPTHGGGSFCSVGAGGREATTLGEERRSNPLLHMKDEDEFVRWFPTTFPATPAYFTRMGPINQRGPRLRRDVPPPPALDPADFDAARERALVVDTRSMDQFAGGHIPGSISIPFRGVYAVWLGWLLPAGTTIAFVVEETDLKRVVDESMLVGFEEFAGWLAGGMDAWTGSGLPVATAEMVDAISARSAIADGAIPVDVREPGEFSAGHLPGAVHVPLGQVAERAGELPRGRPLMVYCAHGDRSSSAVSLLEQAGLGPLLNLRGGVGAWKEAGHPVERPAG